MVSSSYSPFSYNTRRRLSSWILGDFNCPCCLRRNSGIWSLLLFRLGLTLTLWYCSADATTPALETMMQSSIAKVTSHGLTWYNGASVLLFRECLRLPSTVLLLLIVQRISREYSFSERTVILDVDVMKGR